MNLVKERLNIDGVFIWNLHVINEMNDINIHSLFKLRSTYQMIATRAHLKLTQ